jgi:indolepyruvate ferredoxin oxidoreductase beta subunit
MNAMTDTRHLVPQDQLPARPITILVAALGGEGGGVLADWLVAAATAQRFAVQSTSIPGVAQRTGATTYYLEIFPATEERLGGRRPVLALTPSPGNIDIMVASEFVEAGRAMQNGYVTPERTTLVASTHRVYSTLEKMAMGDGRYEEDRLHKAAQGLAKRPVLFDMAALATESGTVINAVLFGALAGSGALPLSREACENAIKGHGKGAEASLRGFGAGWAHATGEAQEQARAAVKHWIGRASERVRATFPAETHRILEEGATRVEAYQDKAYADLYVDRLAPVLKAEREAGGGPSGFKVTTETGRHLALWMCYEDLIRVADLKTRRSRFERVRSEVMAKPDEPVTVVEFLKPGIEEVASVLPRGLAAKLVAYGERKGKSFNRGIYLRTTSIHGFLMLRTMAALRPLRRSTSRWHDEQAMIGRWLAAIVNAAKQDAALALEIALCARLLKGYGDTHRRGRTNFMKLFDTLVEGRPELAPAARAAEIRKAREAALADPEGRTLAGALGLPVPAPTPKPIKLVRRDTVQRGKQVA